MTLTFILPDGSIKEYPKGTTGKEIAEQIGARLAKAAVAIKVGDKPYDLSTPLHEGGDIRILTFADAEGKEIFWHSAAHVMAAAITQIYPDAQLAIGPPVEDGFYYDIQFSQAFSPEEFGKIEERMAAVVKEDLPFIRMEITRPEARSMFKSNAFKLELIDELPEGETLSVYRLGSFTDLCRGPHIQTSGHIKAFKLLKASGAFWRADSKRDQLQRIYGVAFPDKKMLEAHITMLQEAEKRDHKRIGKEMELFMQSELVGKGLPIWLPKGLAIRSTIERYAEETERRAGYVRVATPNLAKTELYKISGHLPYYEESMYPEMILDDGGYRLKPMNCPHHHLIFRNRPRSYRELPFRIAEYGTCYRNELSGTLSGLLRVRMLSMNDAHIYCTREQIAKEFGDVIKLIVDYYAVFGLKDYHFRLSLHDPLKKEKYIDEPESWEYSEEILRNVMRDLKVKFIEAKGEAAFYGPKVDVQYKAVTGREETMSTVQLDFAAKRKFELSYTDRDGKDNPDVYVIHRAPLSTHERFIAFLIEQYAGRFPLWLSPIQVRILTVADRFAPFAKKVFDSYFDAGIRVELDDRPESIPFKVRDAQLAQVNYILVVGEREERDDTVTVRTREGKVEGAVRSDEFLARVKQEIAGKK